MNKLTRCETNSIKLKQFIPLLQCQTCVSANKPVVEFQVPKNNLVITVDQFLGKTVNFVRGSGAVHGKMYVAGIDIKIKDRNFKGCSQLLAQLLSINALNRLSIFLSQILHIESLLLHNISRPLFAAHNVCMPKILYIFSRLIVSNVCV